jgi:hypothetical protein
MSNDVIPSAAITWSGTILGFSMIQYVYYNKYSKIAKIRKSPLEVLTEKKVVHCVTMVI